MSNKQTAPIRYFGEGVSARVWCTPNQWEIVIDRREGRIAYLGLDELKRSAYSLLKTIQSGNSEVELFKDVHEIIPFSTAEDALACMAQVSLAIYHIQKQNQDDAWLDLSALDIFVALKAIEFAKANG